MPNKKEIEVLQMLEDIYPEEEFEIVLEDFDDDEWDETTEEYIPIFDEFEEIENELNSATCITNNRNMT
jgi:hypothetical protein